MPFKHKLSKRLALMRDAAYGLAAVVLACSPDQSISGPPSLLLNSSQPVCQQNAAVWLNSAFAPQTGSFTVQFDGTPNGAAIDGVTGLSAGAAGAYTGLAAIVRFNVAGQIDARNGGAYAAMTAIPYTAGTSYHFRLVVDILSRTYAAYVTPFGGTELTIGTGYAFRTEQSGATALANWASYTSSGTLTLSNFSLGSGTPSAESCQQSAAAWLNNAFAPQTGSFTVQFDGTPNGAAIDGVTGLSAGAAGAYTDLAAIVRFNVAGQIDARNGGAYAAMTAIPYTAGTSYHFRLVVDILSRTYAAYVTPFGGTELTIGTGYAFRTEQSGATALANWASYTSSGTLTLCNVSFGSGIPSASVVSVTVSPASASVETARTVQLTATPEDAAGSPLSGRVVTWASGAPAVATVSGSGLVTAVTAGAATITATSDGQSGTSVLTVQSAPPPPGCTASSLAWLNTAFTAQTGSLTVQFDATPNGAAIDGVAGLSLGAAAAYTDLAVIVRFNVGGTVD